MTRTERVELFVGGKMFIDDYAVGGIRYSNDWQEPAVQAIERLIAI